jgi:hypothetical protein
MLIALTVPEIRRLILALFLARPGDFRKILAWSHFRRRRQWQAHVSHYHRRGQIPP